MTAKQIAELIEKSPHHWNSDPLSWMSASDKRHNPFYSKRALSNVSGDDARDMDSGMNGCVTTSP
eukprot:14921242-Alexandrium_andersonii.AAC.1